MKRLMACIMAMIMLCMVGCRSGATWQEQAQTKAETEPTRAETEPAQTEEKKLLQVKEYSQGGLWRVDTFSYNEQGQLISTKIELNIEGLGEDSVVTLWSRYTYDEAGRLVKADRDDLCLMFASEEYIYNERDELTSYKFFYSTYGQKDYEYDSRGNLTKETCWYVEGNSMEKIAVHSFINVLDIRGRTSDRQGLVDWQSPEFDRTTWFGGAPSPDCVNLTRYTYDSAGRVLSEQKAEIPRAIYESLGDDALTEENWKIKKYCYDYNIFTLSVDDDASSSLIINDSMGHEIWSCMIGESIITEEDGYITAAVDDASDRRYEFAYGKPAPRAEQADYSDVFEQLLEAIRSNYDYQGEYVSEDMMWLLGAMGDDREIYYALHDLNGDDVDELFIGIGYSADDVEYTDVFSHNGFKPVRVVNSGSWGHRASFTLYEDETFDVAGSSGASSFGFMIYYLRKGECTATLIEGGGTDMGVPYLIDSEGNMTELEISEKEFWEMMGENEDETAVQTLDWTKLE